jgi:hypothetical protein
MRSASLRSKSRRRRTVWGTIGEQSSGTSGARPIITHVVLTEAARHELFLAKITGEVLPEKYASVSRLLRENDTWPFGIVAVSGVSQ